MSLLGGAAVPSFHAKSPKNSTPYVILEKSCENNYTKDYYTKYKNIKEKYEKLSKQTQSDNKPGGWINVIRHPFQIMLTSELYLIAGAIISDLFFPGNVPVCAALAAASATCGAISKAASLYKSNK